jgi:hypothetical protein
LLKNIANNLYVEIPLTPPTPTNNQQNELMVNLEDSKPELNGLTNPRQTQKFIELIDLLCLPRFQQGKDMAKSH